MSQRIALIAGNRKLPLVFVQEAKKQGVEVEAICIRQDTSPLIKKYAAKCHWINVWELSKLFDILESRKLRKVAMIGQITPQYLFKAQSKFDAELKSLLARLKDKRADTIFAALADRLNSEGIELIDSTLYLKELMPTPGTLTKTEPSDSEWQDIRLGFQVAKQLGGLDIGQTVVVKDGAILAVEAFEGTDSTILRGGLLGGKGTVVVKTAKPNQDMRFDVPLVGFNTIKKLVKTGAKVLAVEADKTIILDKKTFLNTANRNFLSVVAL